MHHKFISNEMLQIDRKAKKNPKKVSQSNRATVSLY